MPTYQFKLLQKMDSWSQFVAAFRNEADPALRAEYKTVAIAAAQTHGMLFGLGNEPEDALRHLRNVREAVDTEDDSDLINDINEIIEAVNTKLWEKHHEAGTCGRWDCPICDQLSSDDVDPDPGDVNGI